MCSTNLPYSDPDIITDEEVRIASDEALPILNLEYALQEVQEVRGRIAGESDPVKLDRMRSILLHLRAEVAQCDTALTARIQGVHMEQSNLPLPLSAA